MLRLSRHASHAFPGGTGEGVRVGKGVSLSGKMVLLPGERQISSK